MRVGTLVTALLACGPGGAHEFFDRAEGDRAVLLDEKGRERTVPREALDPAAAEGDVLVDGRPDPAATERARREIAERRARLLTADDGADFSLAGDDDGRRDPRP